MSSPLSPARPCISFSSTTKSTSACRKNKCWKNWAFQTDTAANGEEALRLHAETPGRYQLVITDLDMPGSNGLALTERLHHASRTCRFS